jgi:hypothetical protein
MTADSNTTEILTSSLNDKAKRRCLTDDEVLMLEAT